MTRKDYVLIAEAVRVTFNPKMIPDPFGMTKDAMAAYVMTLHKQIADNLASNLASDNGRFDRQRFLNACGLPNWTSVDTSTH